MSAPVMDRPTEDAPAGPVQSGLAPKTRRHRGLRTAGVVLCGLIVVAGAVSSVPEMAQRTEVQDLGWLAGTTTLRVAGGQGEIQVTEAAPGTEPSITVEKTWSFTDPEIRHAVNDGVADLGMRCDLRLFTRCNADWTIVVPAGTAVEVTSDVGDVALESLTGSVKVRGDVGDVRFDGAPSLLDITTSVGDVNALLTSPSESVRVRTAVGDVDLTVPGEVSYDVHTRSSDLADISTNVATDSASPHDIDVTTDIGDINIRPSG